MGVFDKLNHLKRKDIHGQSDDSLFSAFLSRFPAGNDLRKPQPDFLDNTAKILPGELIDFWKEYGFGAYGNGIIKVIDPAEYMEVFYTWLGGVNHSRFPLFMTAFGDIVYYRKLSDTEDDIAVLNVHFRKTAVLAYDFKSFFRHTIADEAVIPDLLHTDLFEQANAKKGPLGPNEIYYFVPALAAGGVMDVQYIDKGDAAAHLQLLYMLGR